MLAQSVETSESMLSFRHDVMWKFIGSVTCHSKPEASGRTKSIGSGDHVTVSSSFP